MTAKIYRGSIGMTLVELMVSLTLAMVIMLLTAAAFRMISTSVSAVNRLGTENQMLRAGYWLCINDADFWSSYADAGAPHLKGFMRVGRGTDSSRPERRAFSPVIFAHEQRVTALSDDQVVNPSVFQAHDPRAWYRGHLLPNRRLAHAYLSGGSPRFAEGKEGTKNVPLGLSNIHGQGDYGLLSATAMPRNDRFPVLPLSGSLTDADLRILNSARPRAMLQWFQRLGYRGVQEYSHGGNPIGFCDQNGRNPSALSQPFLNPAGDTVRWYNAYFGWKTVSGIGSELSESTMINLGGSAALDWTAVFSAFFWDGADAFGYKTTLASERARAQGGIGALTNLDAADSLLAHASGNTGQYSGIIAWNRSDYLRDISRWQYFTASTSRIPYGLTDQERDHAWITTLIGGSAADNRWVDMDSKPRDLPSLRTSTQRFGRFLGGSITVVRAVIESPETGERREIMMAPLSTSYRGARQHWALRHQLAGGTSSTPDAFGNAPIGDFYAP